MADYFNDILDRLRNTAHLAKAVQPHPFTGERERLHARACSDFSFSETASGNDLFSSNRYKGLPDLFSDKVK